MELGRLLQQQCRDLDTIKEECNWIDYKTQHGTWFIVTSTIQITRHTYGTTDIIYLKTQHGT